MHVLDGVKVVELAEHGFVPSCGAILADWGADVVKIEKPPGRPAAADHGRGARRRHRRLQLPLRALQPQQAGHHPRPARRRGPRRVRPAHRAGRRAHHQLPARRRGRSCACCPRTCGRSTRGSCTPRGTARASRGPRPSRAGSTRSASGAAAASATSSRRRRARSSCRAARSATRRAGRCSRAASPPRCSSVSARARASWSTSSLLATAVWQLSTDLTATTILREEPKKLDAGSALPNPLVGPYRTSDERWMMLNMLDDTRHWAPTCRALGAGRPDRRPPLPRHRGAVGRSRRSCTSSSVSGSRRCQLVDLVAAAGRGGHAVLVVSPRRWR